MFEASLHSFSYIGAAVSAVVNFVLIFLLLRHKPRKRANLFLAIWLFTLTLLFQVIGSFIMRARDPAFALALYQWGCAFSGLFSFLYLFVKEFLKIKKEKWLTWLVLSYVFFLPLMTLVKNDFLIKGVRWDETVQFYLLEMSPNAWLLIFASFLPGFWGFYKLYLAYCKSRSAIERNRLKYLMLGALFPFAGAGLIIVPVDAIRRYPLDLFGTVLAAICLIYGVLRYKLLDISIIIRKGLLYSTLTVMITGIYVFIPLLLQPLSQRPSASVFSPTVLTTAALVAVVFQPLNVGTQRFIDKIFSRRKYDFQKLTTELSQIFSGIRDLDLLVKAFVKILCETIQVKKAVLLLIDEEQNTWFTQEARGFGPEIKKITITSDLALTKLLSDVDTAWLIYDLQRNKINLAGLEELGVELFIPLRVQEKLRGILILGPKLSEELYSLEELQLLETIARSAAIAVNNAYLLTQLKREREAQYETAL